MRLDRSLVVNEVYGPTIQGEGPYAGARCSFIRLMGCNLSCSWCDTPYTWDAHRYDLKAEGTRMDVAELAAEATRHARLVIITGGEPLLHQKQKGWPHLLGELTTARNAWVHVETNGTIAPSPVTKTGVLHFSVSPKIGNSEQEPRDRDKRHAIEAFTELANHGRACFKFVCQRPADIHEVLDWQRKYDVDASHIWIMPEGADTVPLLRSTLAVTQPAIDAGFNVSSRLHVLAWGDQRGV